MTTIKDIFNEIFFYFSKKKKINKIINKKNT